MFIIMAELTSRALFKVIRMGRKCLFLVMLLVVIGCQQSSIGQDKPPAASILPSKTAGADKPPTETKPDEQLEINRNALLQGPSEQIRIKAAVLMLYSENPLAREILLEALKQKENTAARAAVCKALIQSRVLEKPVQNKQEFIQPLLEILTTDDSAGAKLAAEATLTFKYEQIQQDLETIATEVSLRVEARLNAIYALKLQPDIRAICKLIDLVDDAESQLAAAARTALYSLGIPPGKDVEARKEIINELKRQGPEAFLRDRLIRRETEMRKLENKLSSWQERYLSALDKICDAITDDAAKGEFLAGHLAALEPTVKLWALEKLEQLRTGTSEPKLFAELEGVLLRLISDQDRDVRLKTAKLLALMTELNSAQHLAEQFKVEQDDEVRLELFVALGGACYYAFLPDSTFKIPKEVRKETLEWAVEYLSAQEPRKVQRGAEVMGKLLEQDGLTTEEADIYLDLLAEEFNRQQNNADGTLRGQLLSAMAGLCAPQSVHNTQARKDFRPLFEKALIDKTDLVREAAIDGLIYIDKAGALKKMRKDLVNDPSAIARKKLIDLAGEVGAKEDLVWLVGKIGSNSESEPAWQAMLKIFNISDADVLNEWIDKLVSQNSQTKLSDDQKISFLKIAERKAAGKNKPGMLKNIREELANLYIAIGQFERAAEYLGLLRGTAQTMQEKEAIVSKLVDVYLRWSKLELVANLVEHCLLKEDLDPNNAVVRSIDNYLLSNPSLGADPNTVLKVLGETKPPEARPLWQQQLKKWAERLGKAEDVEKPGNNGN